MLKVYIFLFNIGFDAFNKAQLEYVVLDPVYTGLHGFTQSRGNDLGEFKVIFTPTTFSTISCY